ncbi:uncharacterized protein CLUP02_14895 [Colletotrichum lupini]|uniref:Uncharacterized protein n=1 Tax=Colletotrichum lupini TaxID=145971 RepID=A0A9Q8T759_9PEZI|nr:uncharacterized protein CLUP02_14895 [Colletotrichum lupini]UQC89366.1 hypothetical protein CLUP02_14895 [Colletotrichum lupini]
MGRQRRTKSFSSASPPSVLPGPYLIRDELYTTEQRGSRGNLNQVPAQPGLPAYGLAARLSKEHDGYLPVAHARCFSKSATIHMASSPPTFHYLTDRSPVTWSRHNPRHSPGTSAEKGIFREFNKLHSWDVLGAPQRQPIGFSSKPSRAARSSGKYPTCPDFIWL